jgi:hypothetical protein
MEWEDKRGLSLSFCKELTPLIRILKDSWWQSPRSLITSHYGPPYMVALEPKCVMHGLGEAYLNHSRWIEGG